MSEVLGMMAVVSISIMLQLIISMSVMVEATKALERAMISAGGACGVMVAGTELLSKARALLSVEVQANIQVSLGILFASSELSSVERVSKMASERSPPAELLGAPASQQQKNRVRARPQREPILAGAPASAAQETCPLPLTATCSCFLYPGRRGRLPA